MAKLGISLFGPFQVLLNREPVTQFESAKVRALLAYLAAESVRSHQREYLAALLWPDWPQQSAMRNLRNALADLRHNIGDREAQPPFLLVTRESLQLNQEADVQVDVAEFQEAIGDQRSVIDDLQSSILNLQSSISLYRGPFLDSFSLPDNTPFEEWLLAKREYFSQQMLKALSRLAEWSFEQGEYTQAEDYARRQIELEPWREQSYQQLMRALSLKGERVQALAQYESLKKALQRELKVEPSEDTLALYLQIREGTLQARKKEATVAKESATQDQIPARPEVPKPHHNLPLQLTSFIGREKEIDAVQHLLQSNRLVTLTGPGGTGKTRLALETAAGLVEQYADGVWLVELAPLSDPALVPALAARALGLRELTGPQAIDLLQEYLEKLQVLLILDNCEHVIEACIRLADTLLQSCPKLTILTSSREALGIAGEVSFRVPPLTFPEIGALPSLETLAQSEAVRLFVERAAATSPNFTLTSTNAPAILQICQRLDGIPLAIELAAARIRMLQVAEIAQRLDDRFRLLTGGSRAALPRYQTLRASIDWSYELLSEAERALLQRLSVFAGGWALEAAEVVGCTEDIQSGDVLELLGTLVDKSLVQVSSEAAGLSRYRMLETIRQYAHEKLVEAGQADAARQRHLMYYLELAERVGGKIRGPDEARILEWLEAELDNLRLALAWSLEGRSRPGWNPELGLRLAAALWWFWHSRGRQDEGIPWLEQLLAGEAEERGTIPFTPERTRCRAKALQVASWLASWIIEGDKAVKMAEESRALYQSLGADRSVGYAWACWPGPTDNLTEDIKIHEQALAIMREAGDRFGEGEFLSALVLDLLNSNEYERAKAYCDENLALRKEIGDLEGLAGAILEQGDLAIYKGEFKRARALVEESMKMLSAVNCISQVGRSYLSLSYFYMSEGNYEQGAIQAREALSIGRRQGDVVLINAGLLRLGDLSLLQGDYQEATQAYEEVLDNGRKKDHKIFIIGAQFHLGDLAWNCGDLEQARIWYTENVNLSRDFNPRVTPIALIMLGKIALARGETCQAGAYIQQALGTPNLDPNEYMQDAMALFAAAQGQEASACRLLGATDTWYTRYYHGIYPRTRQEREACVTAVRATLGEQGYAAVFAEGQAMTRVQAWEYAKGLFPSKQ